MIQITPQMRILLAVEPVDFRKGIDGLAACCRQALGTDPLAGALVVFRSRSRRALKLLVYDGYVNSRIMGRGTLRRGDFLGEWGKINGASSRITGLRERPGRGRERFGACVAWLRVLAGEPGSSVSWRGRPRGTRESC